VCRNAGIKSSISTNLNSLINGVGASTYFDSNSKQLGLSNYNIKVDNGLITCSFSRNNDYSANSLYDNITYNNRFYLMAATGNLNLNLVGNYRFSDSILIQFY
jgi:hypothetical protein